MSGEQNRMRIERAQSPNVTEWAALRRALWPEATKEQHLREIAAIKDNPDWAALLARAEDGALAGFAETAIRHDCVNGCESSPVGFLEGIYVTPSFRRCGVARLLCNAAEAWAAARGCAEFASDTELHNVASQRMHLALGFAETERVIYFRKRLSASDFA